MHLETLAYMFHQLPLDRKVAECSAPLLVLPPDDRMVSIPAGTPLSGIPHSDEFGWDNEFERHTVDVPRLRSTSTWSQTDSFSIS